MNIFVTGGTGLIGRYLITLLLNRGDNVTVLTRSTSKAKKLFGNNIQICDSLKSLKSLDNFDVIINLAGEPIVGKRWTKKQKAILLNSRCDITLRLSELINISTKKPQVFVSGSAIGYYGAQGDNILTEESQARKDFTNTLCEKWEACAMQANSRVCILRTGIVLSPNGGMLSKLVTPFRLGLGAVIGSGKQYISWIHIQDMANGIIHLIDTPSACGVFNFTAQNPVTNKQFSKTLATALHRPCLFKIPSFLIRLVLGESATLLLDGQRALPSNITKVGFNFKFENIEHALTDIYS